MNTLAREDKIPKLGEPGVVPGFGGMTGAMEEKAGIWGKAIAKVMGSLVSSQIKNEIPVPVSSPSEQLLTDEQMQSVAGYVRKEISVARCFGAGEGSESILRRGYKKVLADMSIPTIDVSESEIDSERAGIGLDKSASPVFSSREEINMHDVLFFLKNGAVPALGWDGQISSTEIVLKDLADISKLINMTRVLGLSLVDELEVRRYLRDKLSEKNVPVTKLSPEVIRQERERLGLTDQGGKIDSTRSSLQLQSLEVLAFIDKVLKKATPDLFW